MLWIDWTIRICLSWRKLKYSLFAIFRCVAGIPASAETISYLGRTPVPAASAHAEQLEAAELITQSTEVFSKHNNCSFTSVENQNIRNSSREFFCPVADKIGKNAVTRIHISRLVFTLMFTLHQADMDDRNHCPWINLMLAVYSESRHMNSLSPLFTYTFARDSPCERAKFYWCQAAWIFSIV